MVFKIWKTLELLSDRAGGWARQHFIMALTPWEVLGRIGPALEYRDAFNFAFLCGFTTYTTPQLDYVYVCTRRSLKIVCDEWNQF